MDNGLRLILVELAIAFFHLVGTAVLVGVAYGKIKEKLDSFERWQEHTTELLGNGKPGVFLRKETALEMIATRNQRFGAIEDRVEGVEHRVALLENAN